MIYGTKAKLKGGYWLRKDNLRNYALPPGKEVIIVHLDELRAPATQVEIRFEDSKASDPTYVGSLNDLETDSKLFPPGWEAKLAPPDNKPTHKDRVTDFIEEFTTFIKESQIPPEPKMTDKPTHEVLGGYWFKAGNDQISNCSQLLASKKVVLVRRDRTFVPDFISAKVKFEGKYYFGNHDNLKPLKPIGLLHELKFTTKANNQELIFVQSATGTFGLVNLSCGHPKEFDSLLRVVPFREVTKDEALELFVQITGYEAKDVEPYA